MIDIIIRLPDNMPGTKDNSRWLRWDHLAPVGVREERSDAEQLRDAAAFLAQVARDLGYVLTIEQTQIVARMGGHVDDVKVLPAREDGVYRRAAA